MSARMEPRSAKLADSTVDDRSLDLPKKDSQHLVPTSSARFAPPQTPALGLPNSASGRAQVRPWPRRTSATPEARCDRLPKFQARPRSGTVPHVYVKDLLGETGTKERREERGETGGREYHGPVSIRCSMSCWLLTNPHDVDDGRGKGWEADWRCLGQGYINPGSSRLFGVVAPGSTSSPLTHHASTSRTPRSYTFHHGSGYSQDHQAVGCCRREGLRQPQLHRERHPRAW